MLLNAVIIILREVIEASLLISIFMAFCQAYNVSRRWLPLALAIGLSTAALYAINISTVSQWLDGVGQEVINAGIHIMVYLVLLVFLTLAMTIKTGRNRSLIMIVMLIGVTFASIREGSEIILYIHGFVGIPELLPPVLMGGVIGAGIGLSVGVLFYYLLVNLSSKHGAQLGIFLCLCVAGGMVLQATQLLSQADWITSQYPLWDTTMWLSERSVMGQLLYALVGYEATPTPIQVISYISALSFMIILTTFSYQHSSKGKA